MDAETSAETSQAHTGTGCAECARLDRQSDAAARQHDRSRLTDIAVLRARHLVAAA